MTSRLLITGSRELKDYSVVARAIGVAISELVDAGSTEITIVVGDCPTGADEFTREFVNKTERSMAARGINIKLEVHYAEWHKYGKSAGPKRNKQMVDSGADKALAFFRPGAGNRGTTNCLELIKTAKIDYKEYEG